MKEMWVPIQGMSQYEISTEGVVRRIAHLDSRGSMLPTRIIHPYRQGPADYQIFIRLVSDDNKVIAAPYPWLIHKHFPEISISRCKLIASQIYDKLHKPTRIEPLNLEDEIWEDYEPYKGEIQVSDLGRIKRCARVVQRTDGRKYTVAEKIVLQRKGHFYLKRYGRCLSTAKVVAETFIPNPNNYTKIRHIDGDRNNCCADNLMWFGSRKKKSV